MFRWVLVFFSIHRIFGFQIFTPGKNTFLTTPSATLFGRRGTVRLYSSTISPPKKPVTKQRTGGGGEDGMRPMTHEEVTTALEAYSEAVPIFCNKRKERDDYKFIIDKMAHWSDLVNDGGKRMGSTRRVLGYFSNGRVKAIAATEVRYRGTPHFDVGLLLHNLCVHPKYDRRLVGMKTVQALKVLAIENALILDITPLRLVPSQQLHEISGAAGPLAQEEVIQSTTQEEQEDIDPRIRFYKANCRRTCFVVDTVTSVDIGPFWYEGETPDGALFFFRKRSSAKFDEFEISFDRPRPGGATGSGTVGGARIISAAALSSCQDIKDVLPTVLTLRLTLGRACWEEAIRGSASK